jgi:hypothetical protein
VTQKEKRGLSPKPGFSLCFETKGPTMILGHLGLRTINPELSSEAPLRTGESCGSEINSETKASKIK